MEQVARIYKNVDTEQSEVVSTKVVTTQPPVMATPMQVVVAPAQATPTQVVVAPAQAKASPPDSGNSAEPNSKSLEGAGEVVEVEVEAGQEVGEGVHQPMVDVIKITRRIHNLT